MWEWLQNKQDKLEIEDAIIGKTALYAYAPANSGFQFYNTLESGESLPEGVAGPPAAAVTTAAGETNTSTGARGTTSAPPRQVLDLWRPILESVTLDNQDTIPTTDEQCQPVLAYYRQNHEISLSLAQVRLRVVHIKSIRCDLTYTQYVDERWADTYFLVHGSNPYSKGDYFAYLDHLSWIESRREVDCNKSYNPNYYGLYQTGYSALRDVGVMNLSNEFIENEFGMSSWDQFLADSALQNEIKIAYDANIIGYLKNFGLLEYVGREIDGRYVTLSGLVTAAHLAGVTNLNTAIKSNSLAELSDDYGTGAAFYMELFAAYEMWQPIKRSNES